MQEKKLKTAVLGLNDQGRFLLKTAADTDHFQIQAVADKDTELAEKISAEYGCLAYDDYRQLIIQNHFDCLLVASPIHNCADYLRMAIKKKFNILKTAPAARNYEETAQFVRLAEDQNIKFAIANTARFAESFLALRQFLNQQSVDQIPLITAVCNFAPGLRPAWQTDPKLAGGGVLLHDCYQIIDQIVWNFGIPQQVYSLNTNQAADRKQRLFLTEDTAIVTMKFADTSFGNLIAARTFGPEQTTLKVYTKDKILTVCEQNFTVSNAQGLIIEESQYNDNKTSRLKKLLENFAMSIISPDKNHFYSSAADNLKNMAVIESGYLSARTAMPEDPGKILEMTKTELTTLWPEHKE